MRAINLLVTCTLLYNVIVIIEVGEKHQVNYLEPQIATELFHLKSNVVVKLFNMPIDIRTELNMVLNLKYCRLFKHANIDAQGIKDTIHVLPYFKVVNSFALEQFLASKSSGSEQRED